MTKYCPPLPSLLHLSPDERLALAMRACERKYEDVAPQNENWAPKNARKWLSTGPVDSYNNRINRIQFFVLEGSPPKGYVIHSEPEERALTIAYNGFFERIKIYYAVQANIRELKNWEKKILVDMRRSLGGKLLSMNL